MTGEKFLVLEIFPGEKALAADALFLGVDDDHKLTLEKLAENVDLGKFLRSPWRRLSQKSWDGNYLFKSRRRIIVSADPSLATTLSVPLDLVRDRARWKEEITLDELENLIAQAMQKVFTQCRSEAAKRLLIDDIHTILVGAKADQFRVDKHAVMSPVGFTANKISLLLELTFTTRTVFEYLKQFFNAPDEFFFIESAQAYLLAIARTHKLPLSVVVSGERSTPRLFILQESDDGYPGLYRESFGWSFQSMFRHIADELGIDIETAKEIYRLYRAGGLSEPAERAFKKSIQSTVGGLEEEIAKAGVDGSVYLDATHPLPFSAPHKYKGAHFENVPVTEILMEVGLETEPDVELPPDALHRLAPFFEAYLAKTTSEINQKLRRRLHWLAE